MSESSKRPPVDYDDLPADPQEGFLFLEDAYRKRMEAVMNEEMNGNEYSHYVSEYANQVIAAADALGIDELSGWANNLPLTDNREQRKFQFSVEALVTKFKIQKAARTKTYSVPLDDATRGKLRHFVQQIRETLDKLEIEERRRESLHLKLSAFAAEVDRNRTRFDAYAALGLDIASASGEAAKQLEPIRKLFDSVANVLGKAVELINPPARLVAPTKPKQIPGPPPKATAQHPKPSWDAGKGDLDDEIPF